MVEFNSKLFILPHFDSLPVYILTLAKRAQLTQRLDFHTNIFNPLVPNAPFFYPLKTSENRTVF